MVVGSGGCLDGGDMEEEGEESEIWEFSWKSIGRFKKCIPKKIFYLEEKIKKLRRVRQLKQQSMGKQQRNLVIFIPRKKT